jgi:multicomponent Na+:H+ antiporter subunit A
LEISELLGRGEAVEAHRLYGPILLLILLGAFTKSAQFPFHFWLPRAMEAPTPVSAYLHSATMVKAGIYLLARLTPVLGGTEAWHFAVTSAGAATMLLGSVLAFLETDLKRILAYSTVAALGILTLLLGLDTVEAVKAAMVFLVVHSLYKGALFLVAGTLDHEAGTRNVDELGGLAGAMPVTAVAAGLAALSMAGLPPMLGFISKELVYEATLQAPRVAELITGAGVLANIVLVAVAGLAGLRPFFGERRKTLLVAHEAPASLWLGPVILAGLGFLAGLAPDRTATFVAPAVAAIRAETTEISLALWHGLNPMLVLSGLTLAGGVALYLSRAPVVRATARRERLAKWGPEGAYELGLDGLNALARGQTRILQSGYLRYYLLGIIGTTIGLVTYALWRSGLPASLPWQSRAEFLEVAVVGLILLAALAAVRSGSRLAAVAALGVVGYGVALLYVIFGAPDLAMTQLSIETLTVILLVLVLYHLPRFAAQSSRGARTRDTVVAVAVGGLMATLVWLAGAVQFQPPISPYFADKSVPEAHGRNVVNVILVDFRALDTLGEITVLALAGLGVYALLKGRIEGAER